MKVLARLSILFFLSIWPSVAYSELGDAKDVVMGRFGEPVLMEKFDHLDDMLFWGRANPEGKPFDYWGYYGAASSNGYGTPGKTIIFHENKMVFFMVLCGPRLYRCEWQLRETLPRELHGITPKVIVEEKLREAGWENERAKAIFIWDTREVYVETVVSEYDKNHWLNSKIFGSVKALPRMVLRPPSEVKD